MTASRASLDEVVDAVVAYVGAATYADVLAVLTVQLDSVEARAARSRAYADWGAAEALVMSVLGGGPAAERVLAADAAARERATAAARQFVEQDGAGR